MNPGTSPPFVPIGKIKTFGALGEKYEVGRALRQIDYGDWLVEIIMVGSVEKAEYRLTSLGDDPDAV